MAKASQNVMLAAALALLSYVPFVVVAKTTLIVCAVLFITDPFPPTSRLVSLLAVVMVGFLARTEKSVREAQQQEEEEEERGGGGEAEQNVPYSTTNQGDRNAHDNATTGTVVDAKKDQ